MFKEILDCILSSKCTFSVSERTFRGLHRENCFIASLVQKKIYKILSHMNSPRHLLWALLFQKAYNIEEYNGTLVKMDVKKLRK